MSSFLKSSLLQFRYYKELGEKTIEQVPDIKLSFQINNETNSINTIVKHLSGNMISRWTDFLNSDGEKEFRNRDDEFNDTIESKKELMEIWEQGWNVLFDTLEGLSFQDLEKIIYIRNEGHTVIESINRQLCHYSYHVGQIVMIGKIICGDKWNSLSIPKGESQSFNLNKFSKDKDRRHFLE
ncbi:DUF1572 domain-containing protein [Flavobacteriaceae bacterium]|jgi:hypothetical protein|nr:DUF1572 domain-containing protein [Flavobacteriaceae bacterium]MDA9041771.1 DUF1572 domain-containing protein [Flavobacteriaceae bacterium]MDA9211889.1 DUF1572 domain-containing protein [Flavobacteriaceae bacterium]MDB3963753.1 DUF1572 domain-containing protein [Flavobacteriaceae bacterium]MDC0479637.1 DUF1572 domain-containing protein [Flavobacteriaceae bacterium]